MLTFPLEPTTESANPAFKNASSCKKWLKQLQTDNPSTAQPLLRAQLDELNRLTVRGLDRMEALEVLRETVHELQEACAGKLAGKPLPLGETELVMLGSITGLWQAMAVGYYRCLLDFEQGDKQLRRYGALLCHRSLMYCGKVIFEFLRTGYEFDGEQWRQLHAVFLFAEEQGLLSEEVEDEFGGDRETSSCSYVYLKTLLSCHARAQELTLHEQKLLDAWLSQWMKNFTIESTCAVSRGDAPPLAIDPASKLGLQPVKPEFLESANIRYLPMVPISKEIRVKTILLQQGESPQRLGLSDEHDRIDCLDLLGHLHKQWCEPRAARQAERQATSQEMLVRYTLEDAYSWIAKQPFDPAKKASATMEEKWRAADLSMLGARLTRPTQTGARVALNQIVAVRNGNTFQMAITVWVSITRTGELHMGIRFLPGAASPVIIKAAGRPGIPPPKPAAALLLSAMPNLGIPASLLLPRGLFVPDRIAEAAAPDGPAQRVKMRFSVEQGTNFERIGFVPE
jgi:cyclic-di-GMP-binding protein